MQKDFGNAYKNWNKDTSPSDVGYITEYFRKLPGTLRSDQATHAAAAQGRLAEEITKDHVAYGPRIGSFGDYAFSYGSPWQKLYELDGKIIFLGVRTRVGTIRHMVEYVLVEKVLKLHPEVLPETRQFGTPLDEYFWPYINVLTFEEEFIKRGLLTSAPCGDAEFLCIKAKDFVDLELKLSVEKPREFISFRTADEEKLARWYSYLTEIDDKMPLWEK